MSPFYGLALRVNPPRPFIRGLSVGFCPTVRRHALSIAKLYELQGNSDMRNFMLGLGFGPNDGSPKK
jgi:hypothetical protein